MLCHECGRKISDGNSHCTACNAAEAASAPERCAVCKASITTGHHFCLRCGNRLARAVNDRSSEPSAAEIDLAAALFSKPRCWQPVVAEVKLAPTGNQLPATGYDDYRRRRTIRTLAVAGTPMLAAFLAILSWSFWFSSRPAPIALVAEQSIISVPPDGTVIVGARASGGTPESLVWKIRESNAGVVVPLGATAVGPRLFFRASYHAPKARGEYHLIAQSLTCSPRNSPD
ncbi:MAG: zinc ribbon domain-containing protein [Acidobacteriia bacterium]|nr:zinc ribbon domain-containing protein [Terriglobia bacterium]